MLLVFIASVCSSLLEIHSRHAFQIAERKAKIRVRRALHIVLSLNFSLPYSLYPSSSLSLFSYLIVDNNVDVGLDVAVDDGICFRHL